MPRSGGVLIVSNHSSMLDTVLIPSFAPRKVQFLAKASLFSGPVRGWFFRGIGAVPVHRGESSAAQAALEAGSEVLAAGNVFAVFPEGSRSSDGRLYRGRGGAAWLALETGATVMPVGILGTGSRTRDGGTGDSDSGKRQRVEIHFGTPFTLDDLAELPAGRARREGTERIMAAIQALTGQERVERFAEGSLGA